MLEAWSPWQVTMGSWALTYLLHSTVLMGLAWGITRLVWFRGPRTREVIWTVALVGGLATSSGATLDRTRGIDRNEVDVALTLVRAGVPSPVPGAHAERLFWQGDEADFPNAAEGPGEAAFPGGAEGPGEACRAALTAPGPGGPTWLESMREACMPGGGTRWLLPLLGLWLAGVVAFGWGELRGHLALHRIRRGLKPAGPRVTHSLAGVTDGLRVGAVRARVSLEVDTPCVLDSRTVVLPPRCRDELEDAELTAVLAHEVAHIIRHDVRRQSLFRVIAVAFWFQPLNRLALAQLHALAELICDDWAVGRIRQPVDLARSISRVAEWSVSRSTHLPILAGSQGGCLTERVRRILGSRGRVGTEGRLRGMLVAAALVLCLTWVPAVPVPGSVRAVFFFMEEVQVERGAPSLDFVQTGTVTPGAMHQMRVRVREVGS